ncbi:DUF3306 domain-containing protein [Photobacterium sp. BZF1]|uniref:DUF3306 domain-containing protein n=1 Tax=Photobacterium sp. BZF1 TaxID=1904457 RepID=UPI001653D8A3|nr:DUF3306 domain-containing protein [Photobacterium sp. BZF1]
MATNFFQRWSQRKIKAKDEAEEQLEQGVTDHVLTEHEASDENLKNDEPIASEPEISERNEVEEFAGKDIGSEPQDTAPELTLADAAKVTFDSGVTTFMKQGVEKSVKKAALRKLFHSDEFNYISDMDDHTEDFSNVPVLDTKVTQQLRQWVNEVAETAEKALNAGTETGDQAHTSDTGSLEANTSEANIVEVSPEQLDSESSGTSETDSKDPVDVETGLALTIPTEVASEEKPFSDGKLVKRS